MELLQRSLFRKIRCTKARRIATKYLVIDTEKKVTYETLDGCICHSEISTVRLTDWSQLGVDY